MKLFLWSRRLELFHHNLLSVARGRTQFIGASFHRVPTYTYHTNSSVLGRPLKSKSKSPTLKGDVMAKKRPRENGNESESPGIFDRHHLGIYILPTKLSKIEIKELTTQVISNGAQVVDNIEQANIIVSSITSPQRILRYTPNKEGIGQDQIVVKKSWLDRCLNLKEYVDVDDFQINIPSKQSSQNEAVKSTTYTKVDEFFQSTRPPTFGVVHKSLDPNFKNAKFSCEQPTPLICPNQGLCKQLQVLEHFRELKKEDMSALSYSKGIASIRSYPRAITSVEEAEKINHVGKKIASKIQEYLETGEISEVREIFLSEEYNILNLFWSIHDVGPSKALAWYEKGYRTIDDIITHEWDHLSNSQKIGITFREEFAEKISRGDSERIVAQVMAVCDKVNPGCNYTVCGGYRRGKTEIGDIDLIITHPVPKKEQFMLEQLVEQLEVEGIVTHRLLFSQSFSRRNMVDHIGSKPSTKQYTMDTLDKLFGVVKDDNGKHRRLDIIITPIQLYASTVFGWTGSKQFERDFRRYVELQGLQFDSSYGLRDRETLETKCLAKTEDEIFRYVGLSYLDPTLRNS